MSDCKLLFTKHERHADIQLTPLEWKFGNLAECRSYVIRSVMVEMGGKWRFNVVKSF